MRALVVALGFLVAACGPDRGSVTSGDVLATMTLSGYVETRVGDHYVGFDVEKNEIVLFDLDGNRVDGDVVTTDLNCPKVTPYSLTRADAGGLAAVFKCPIPDVGVRAQAVYSRDGVQRTLSAPLPGAPQYSSWDLTRDEVWISFDNSLCASVAIVDTAGNVRQPDLVVDGEQLRLQPIPYTQGMTCSGYDNVGEASVSPDGQFVALVYSTENQDKSGTDRAGAADTLAVFRIDDLSLVDTFGFDEAHGPAWSPDSRSLLVDADQGDGRSTYLIRPGAGGEVTRVSSVHGSSTWAADGTSALIMSTDFDTNENTVSRIEVPT